MAKTLDEGSIKRDESAFKKLITSTRENNNITVDATPTKKVVSHHVFMNFVKAVSSLYDVEEAIAITGIFLAYQLGGINSSKRVNIKVVVSDTTFESQTINKQLRLCTPDFTPRQFAKSFCNDIFDIAKKHDTPGNAVTQLKRFYSDKYDTALDEIGSDTPFWCSDFQIDNQRCPESIRSLLSLRYQDRFAKQKQS